MTANKQIYVLRPFFEGDRDYDGYSQDLTMSQERNEYWELLQGTFNPKTNWTCVLPSGLPSSKAIMSVNVLVPILTPEAAELWRKNEISGWKGLPVKLYDQRKKCSLGTGSCISVSGRAGPLRHGPLSSGSKHGDLVTHHVGIFPDMSAWDGSDLFLSYPVTTGFIFVTERVKYVTETAGIIGVKFVPLEEFEHPVASDARF